jgi:DNA replication and repair protein RecF
VQVSTISFKNFRCFPTLDLTILDSCVVVSGGNGTGKTTVLEGLHYLCYLRSFRTHTPRDLIRFNTNHFFIKAQYYQQRNSTEQHSIQVGFEGAKRLVKIDNRTISSYKDLINQFRVITMTEDDVMLIKGGPDQRRIFIDHALIIKEPELLADMKTFKSILGNRNMLLKSGKTNSESYDIWTQQLLKVSVKVQRKRQELLYALSHVVNTFIQQYFETGLSITIHYKEKEALLSDEFKKQEYRWGRSLFGAHLDDFFIQYEGKYSRSFASRGQQKLIIFLLKVAQIKVLGGDAGGSCMFLIDDFLTDFDEKTIEKLVEVTLSLPGQKLFTLPAKNNFFESVLNKYGTFQSIELTS